MNITVPRPPAPGVPILKPTPAGPYPRRVTGCPAGTHQIIIGATGQDVTAAQRWVYEQWLEMDAGRSRACDAASVAVALVANAHQHTASGLPGGETTVTVRRDPARPYWADISVTDQGPRPGMVRPPLPELRADRRGLHLVEHIAVYWDWDATASGAVTMRAALEMP